MTTRRIGRSQARLIALAAQGFRDPDVKGTVTRRHVSRVINRVKVVQIDSVNVISRSHYLPFFSRLGGYQHEVVDARRDRKSPSAALRSRADDLVEYWAHEASLIPVTTWPYLSFRMRSPQALAYGSAIEAAHPGLLDAVTDVVLSQGPMTSREVQAALPHAQAAGREHWGWNWSAVKQCLEQLFWVGALTSAGRTAQFERRYAGVQTVLPADVAARGPHGGDAPGDLECAVELMRQSVRAHGIGTEPCLRDYFRLPPVLARAGLAELLRGGEVEAVQIEGWPRPAYLDVGATRPRSVSGSALLSPFDSLIWQRERTERLFDFTYRLEIYVPAPKRVYGYYVLPFLLDSQLVARVDLKADRKDGILRARAIAYEATAPRHSAGALREELAAMADWLQLDGIALP